MRNLIGIGIVAVVLIGGFIFRDFLSGNAAELKVGDCFDEPATLDETVEDVQHHPCGDEHDAEVFFIGDYPGGDDAAYPTDAEMEAWVTQACFPAFKSYTGKDFETDPDLGIGWFQPDESSWDDGHEISCYLYRLDGTTIKGSQKAA
ncbi:MAG: hypothetical protein EPO36_04055 [Chloroflexota bacterium]|nr:MAG: hypothetical protein EPO36_04055 [Chloroflexota bacterium]